jgi:hypothetical protein
VLALPLGQVVFTDDGLSGVDRYRVHRDQGSGGRGEHRAARRPAGSAALLYPPLPDQPQVPFTVKPGHSSMLALRRQSHQKSQNGGSRASTVS